MIFETTDLSFFFGLEKDAQCTLGWDIYDFFCFSLPLISQATLHLFQNQNQQIHPNL